MESFPCSSFNTTLYLLNSAITVHFLPELASLYMLINSRVTYGVTQNILHKIGRMPGSDSEN